MQAQPENSKQAPASGNEQVNILIFKTGISQKKDMEMIRRTLRNIEGIITWTLDQEDIDKVLRIKTRTLSISQIIHIVNRAGFTCEELED